MSVQYSTETLIPLEAFQKFGINVKPGSTSPFGFFGTGLKYAVSVILREGGSFRLFRENIEYEFYLKDMDFRGKNFSEVCMRKRKKGLRWSKSIPLPFTTELGKNWGLWQAHRELESNTRDENGFTEIVSEKNDHPQGLTTIIIDCPGFDEVAQNTAIFLPDDIQDRFECVETDTFFAYKNRPANSLYYQGIKVYDTRKPTRWTYDFKPGCVKLTEDRTLADVWSVQYDLALKIQKLNLSDLTSIFDTEEPSFESDDLVYHGHSVTESFNVVARSSSKKSLVGYTAVYLSKPVSKNNILTLTRDETSLIVKLLKGAEEHSLAKKIKRQSNNDEIPF